MPTKSFCPLKRNGSTTIQKTLKKAEEETSLRLKDLENQNVEEKERNNKLQEQLLELNKTLRELQTKDKERDLEMEKKLRSEAEKIRLESEDNKIFLVNLI